jgi:hypothetical protein
MSKVGGDFSHYAGGQVAHKTDAERKAAVAAIVAARRAKEAEEAELERIAAEQYVPFDHIAYLKSIGIDPDAPLEIPGTRFNRVTGEKENIVFRIKA